MPPQVFIGVTQERLRRELKRFIDVLFEYGYSRDEVISTVLTAYRVFHIESSRGGG